MHKPSTATSSTIAHLEKQRRQRAKIPAYDPTVESKKTLLKRFFSIRRPNVTIDGRRIPIARESEAIVCDLDELRDLAQKNLSLLPETTDPYEKLRILTDTFTALTPHFRVFEPLLSEIKKEYDLVIQGILNTSHEVAFLKSKAQKCVLANGFKGEIEKRHADLCALGKDVRGVKVDNILIRKELKATDNLLILCLADLFKSEKEKEEFKNDPRLKSKFSYIKDWVSRHAEKDKLFAELAADMDANPASYKQMLKSTGADEDAEGDTSSWGVELPTDTMRESEIKREIRKKNRKIFQLDNRIIIYKDEISVMDRKIEEAKRIYDAAKETYDFQKSLLDGEVELTEDELAQLRGFEIGIDDDGAESS